MTDLETVATLEARAAAAEQALLRLEVAEAKGLKVDLAKRLQGSTRQELEADADELIEAFRPKRTRTRQSEDVADFQPDLQPKRLYPGRGPRDLGFSTDPLLRTLERAGVVRRTGFFSR